MRQKTIVRHVVRLTEAVVLMFILVGLTGCFSSNPKDIEAFAKPDEVDVTCESYILQPPDEVEIHCSSIPELHLQHQQIRPDGKVSFEGIGQIDAAGKTPSQLAEVLKEKALSLYAVMGDNPIDVRVVGFESKVYYVIGQVYYTGSKEYTGRDTVLTAIAEARPTNLAWLNRIQVIRPSKDKNVKPKIFELNYDRMTAHGDASKNVLLQEGDIVFVPPTIMGAIGLKVAEFVSPIGQAFSTVNIVQGPPGSR